MDGEKRAVISAEWFLAAHAPLSADSPAARPRVAVARDLIAKAAAAPEGILEESVLDEAERAAMGGMARASEAPGTRPFARRNGSESGTASRLARSKWPPSSRAKQ